MQGSLEENGFSIISLSLLPEFMWNTNMVKDNQILDNKFLLNDEELPYDTIKKIILNSNLNEDEYLVVAKPSGKTNLQQTLDIIADLTRSKIKNISLGINKPKDKKTK